MIKVASATKPFTRLKTFFMGSTLRSLSRRASQGDGARPRFPSLDARSRGEFADPATGRPRFDRPSFAERGTLSERICAVGPLEGWGHLKVTDRHTAVDYAHVLRDLA